MRMIDKETFFLDPDRYQLRSGKTEGAPLCPYGNHYEWVGFDLQEEEYVRFTKSVFKLLIFQQHVEKDSSEDNT